MAGLQLRRGASWRGIHADLRYAEGIGGIGKIHSLGKGDFKKAFGRSEQNNYHTMYAA
jgi:hypothetical protein